jgi:hypothetical protein
MAETLKVLGQAAPAATTLTALYTVPSGKSTAASTLVVCNQNNTKIAFRISVAVGGAADAPQQYLYYDAGLFGNSSVIATMGISLGSGDIVRVQSDTANVSFNLFGVEET